MEKLRKGNDFLDRFPWMRRCHHGVKTLAIWTNAKSIEGVFPLSCMRPNDAAQLYFAANQLGQQSIIALGTVARVGYENNLAGIPHLGIGVVNEGTTGCESFFVEACKPFICRSIQNLYLQRVSS